MRLRTPDTTVGPFHERDTVLLTATVKDNLQVAIPGSSLETFIYSLFVESGLQGYINSREEVDMLTDVNEAGELSLYLEPDDMIIVDADQLEEYHRVLLRWTWDGGKTGSYEIRVIVQNLAKIDIV